MDRPWTPNEELPLAGIRILSLEQAAALPSGTRHLANLGADVIWIQSHKRNPVSGGVDLYRNKRRLAIDLASPEGPEVFRRVAANVDVVAHNFTPKVVRRFSIDYPAIRAVNPDVIYLSHTGFGMNGPFSERPLLGPATEAMSGHNLLIGEEENWPGRPGTATYIDHTCGMNAAFTVMAALAERDRSGRGQHIDLSLYEAAVSHLGAVIAERAFGSALPTRIGNRDLRYALHGVFSALGTDREVAIAARHGQESALCAALGLDSVSDHAVRASVAGMQAEAVVQRLQAAGVAASVVADGSDVATDQHLWARGYLGVSEGYPLNGPPWGGGVAITIAETRPVGADTRDVLREVAGYTDAEIDALIAADVVGQADGTAPSPEGRGQAPNPARAAIGIERGELSRSDAEFDAWRGLAETHSPGAVEARATPVPGPEKLERRFRAIYLGGGAGPAYAAKLLADSGWDVVFLEPPSGDPLRSATSRWTGGKGGAFAFLAQGERSVIARDREMLERLVASCDVAIGDLSPEGCRLSGLSREDFSNLIPKLVMVSVSPFGLVGPKADWAAEDIVVQAASGMMFLNGEWNEQPMQLPPYAAAFMGGIAAAGATFAAMRLARSDGKVRRLDISQQEAMAGHASGALSRYVRTGDVMRREQRLKFGVRMAPTAEGFIACSPGPLAASNMLGIAKLLDEPRLAEDKFQTGEGRMQNWDEFFSIFIPPFARKTAKQWFIQAEALDLTFALVQTVDEILACEQLSHRRFFHSAPGPDGKQVMLPGPAFITEDGPARIRSDAAAQPGQHTAEVLAEWLEDSPR